MQKVYLLLRDNQRTGPYSLEELLELQLQPFDLVWVDGRSTGWRYPAEIDSLKIYVCEDPKPLTTTESQSVSAPDIKSPETVIPVQSSVPSVKKIFVSMPGKGRTSNPYQRDEEIAKHCIPETISAIPKYAPGYQEPVSTIPDRISDKPLFKTAVQKQEYSPLFFPRKKKQRFVSSRSIAAFIILMVTGAAAYYFLTAGRAKAPSQNLVSQSVQQPVIEDPETTTETIAEENKLAVSNYSSIKKEKLTKQSTDPGIKKNNQKSSVILPTVDQTINKEPSMPETVEVNNKSEDVIPPPSPKTEPKEKKKKLGEVIKDIFKPKEKVREEEKKETVMDEPRPSTNRQSTKRDDDKEETKTNAQPNIDLTSMVDISSNSPDNWMMGVKGLKVTLRNRSNIAVQTASVEVVYYNDNNQVLEKKLIYFSNVAAKGKLTIAAPDHKYADHVEFKLTTVTAKEDRFARN